MSKLDLKKALESFKSIFVIIDDYEMLRFLDCILLALFESDDFTLDTVTLRTKTEIDYHRLKGESAKNHLMFISYADVFKSALYYLDKKGLVTNFIIDHNIIKVTLNYEGMVKLDLGGFKREAKNENLKFKINTYFWIISIVSLILAITSHISINKIINFLLN